MTFIDRPRLQRTLTRHEGLKLKPYRCTAGKLTIGVGRNLDDQGITPTEAFFLLAADIDRLIRNPDMLDLIAHLDSVRAEVLLNMAFNLGVKGLLGFEKMLAAVKAGDYEEASREMLRSKWAEQVGGRANELARWMRTGKVEDANA